MLRVNILLVWQVSKGKNEILDDCAIHRHWKLLSLHANELPFNLKIWLRRFILRFVGKLHVQLTMKLHLISQFRSIITATRYT